MKTAKQPKRVKVGMKFRAPYADANPVWEVKRNGGIGIWICQIVNEQYIIDGQTYEGDYVGVTKAFMAREILAAAGWERQMEAVQDEQEAFYSSLRPGTIVHYNNGHNNYVRCKVTAGKDLMPVALVGDWADYDLPKRRRDGEVYYPYHARHVVEQTPFKPHFSNIYESPRFARNRYKDPRLMEPINLDVPEMTAEQGEAARWWQMCEQFGAAINESLDAKATLRSIYDRLKEEFEK